jgi:hypothetical protein
MTRHLSILVLLAALAVQTFGSFPIPAARKVDWSLSGIAGGIPTNLTQFADLTQAPYSADNTGVIPCSVALNAALLACPSNQFVYLPPGTYNLTNTVRLRSNGAGIRGAGSRQTFLKRTTSLADGGVYVFDWETPGFSFDYSSTTAYAMTGAVAGATSVTCGTHDFAPGDLVLLDELEDGVTTSRVGSTGSATWTGRASGARCHSQLVTVLTTPTANSFSFTPPVALAITNQPECIRQAGTLRRAFIEALSVTNYDAGDQGATSPDHIMFIGSAFECWMKDCELALSKRRCGWLYSIANCEFRGMWMHHGIGTEWSSPAYDADRAYGFYIGLNCTGLRFEDNIGYKLHFMYAMEGAGPYNVYAYSDVSEVEFNSGGTPQPCGGNHAGWPHMNLFEGNRFASKILCDSYFGGNGFTTFYRNHLTIPYASGAASNIVNDQYSFVFDLWGRAVNAGSLGAYYHNVVGNVLGTRGFELDYEAPPGKQFTITSGNRAIYRLGNTNANEPWDIGEVRDPQVSATLLRAMNWDSTTVTNGGLVVGGAFTTNDLPPSLYRTTELDVGQAPGWPVLGQIGPHLGSNAPAAFLPATERRIAILLNIPTNYLTQRFIDKGPFVRGIRRRP